MQVLKFDAAHSDLNEYSSHVHALNHKWWHDVDGNPLDLYKPERFMLIISEVAEGMEGYRKSLQDDHLPQYPMLWVEMADVVIRVLDCAHVYEWDLIPGDIYYTEVPDRITGQLFAACDFINQLAVSEFDGWDDEPLFETGQMAHRIILECNDIAMKGGCEDFWQVVYDKLVYNWSRIDHSYAARAAENGKKF